MTIEEFENLDCNLAAVVQPVAELRSGELPVLCLGTEINDNFNHLRHGRAQKEMVVRNLIDLTHAAQQFE